MWREVTMQRFSMARRLCAALLMLAAGAAGAQSSEPSFDGLQRVPSRDVEILFVKPGATLAQYRRVALLDCYVAFRKNWQRDRAPGTGVGTREMDRIKSDLADEFRKVFTAELQKGGYEMATRGDEDVLILRPAIIDLDVTAPNSMAPGRQRTFATSAGSMTLYLEVYDGASGEILARVVDPQAGRDSGMIEWQTSVTNRAEADRIIGKWAALTRAALDRARQPRDGSVIQ
jgi:hypothetical protein